MEENKVVHPRDLTRALAKKIVFLEDWREGNELCDQRVTSIIITKLQEALLWSYAMVKSEDYSEDIFKL